MTVVLPKRDRQDLIKFASHVSTLPPDEKNERCVTPKLNFTLQQYPH